MRQLIAWRTSVIKTVGLALFALNIVKAVYAGYKNTPPQEIIVELPEQTTDAPKTGSMKSLVWIGMVLLAGVVFIRGRNRSTSSHENKTL
ncbi:MAG: LPXTG cell wall anchor domain-containing protein [Bacteroidota bacterium]